MVNTIRVFVFVLFSGYLTKMPKVFKKLNDSEKYNDEVDWELPSDV